MKNHSIWICFLLTSNYALAQKECGTKAPHEQEYNRTLARAALRPQNTLAGISYIRVFIVNYLSDNGVDSSWSSEEINNEFQLAKDLMKPYNICLVLVGVEHIKNTSLQNYNSVNPAALVASSYHNNSLNMYLHKTLAPPGLGTLNGLAYELNSDKLSLSRGAISQRSMLHEVGHCFGLLHTFETAYGLECPNGSNSSTAGDKLTDTRATPDDDPYMTSNTNSSCNYTGTLTAFCDGVEYLYNPEIKNLMSYGRRTCRSEFSNNQMGLMLGNLSSAFWLLRSSLLLSGNYVFNQTLDYDIALIGSYMEIGNNSNTITTILGNTAKQRYLSETKIVVRPGTKITALSNRAKIILKPTAVCDETINYSF